MGNQLLQSGLSSIDWDAKPIPVFSCFILKQTIAVLHLLCGHRVDLDFWVLLGYFPESIEDVSFPVLPHVPLRTPEHVCGVCRLLEIVALVFYQQGNTCVRDNPDAGAAPDVFLVPLCGRIVHPDHASDFVNLFSYAGCEHLT